MLEGKRQKQVAGILLKELNDIFLRFGLNMLNGGMVSISKVKLTPDLLEARVYLSIFQAKDPDEILRKFEDRKKEIRRALGNRVKNQLRRIPELRFYKDDTLDEVFRLENIFKKIHDEDEKRNNGKK